jgi:hypothetical protein
MDYVLNHWQLIAVVLGVIILLLCYRWVLALCGVILIPDDSVGIMTKKFVILGKNRRLPAGHAASWTSLGNVALAISSRIGQVLYRASGKGGLRPGVRRKTTTKRPNCRPVGDLRCISRRTGVP